MSDDEQAKLFQAFTQGSKVISRGGAKMLPRRISGMPLSEVTTIT